MLERLALLLAAIAALAYGLYILPAAMTDSASCYTDHPINSVMCRDLGITSR